MMKIFNIIFVNFSYGQCLLIHLGVDQNTWPSQKYNIILKYITNIRGKFNRLQCTTTVSSDHYKISSKTCDCHLYKYKFKYFQKIKIHIPYLYNRYIENFQIKF